MKKRKLLYLIPVIVLLAVYFGLYHKNKDLKYIPDSADAVLVIDVKNLTRKYLAETLTHPSVWFKDGKKNDQISWSSAGIKIPDFVQIFHLKNDEISSWYAVFEIKDKEELLLFLKDRKFQTRGNDLFNNGKVDIKISGHLCIVGINQKSFVIIDNSLKKNNNIRNADDFITDGIGGLGIIRNQKTEKYSINLEDNFFEISNFKDFRSDEFPLLKTRSKHFLEAKFDQNHLQIISKIFKSDIFSDPDIQSLEMISDLKQEADTIISYDYDENFNEVEKVSYQKITQPQYQIQIKSEHPDLVWNSFEQRNKIDEKQQFTAIPFLPNEILKSQNSILIRSKKHPVLKDFPQQNFVLIKNDPLLLSSFKTLSPEIRKKLDEVESFFYLIDKNQRMLRFNFKFDDLPLILR